VELIASADDQPQPIEAVVGVQSTQLANAFVFICRRAKLRASS
jgi:hypothetical protein